MRADSQEVFRNLYPPIEPYAQEWLDVGDGHRLYLEQSGNPTGYPVIFLHGGPGGGTGPSQRQFFNPDFFRIILFDQRGCGQSRPHAHLEANSTWHLVEDIEKIRHHLGLEKFALFGGSWGSTLALLYAETYPDSVSHLILRGIFLLQKEELDWFYGYGTRALFPEAYANFIAPIPVEERHDLIAAYYKRLTGPLSDADKIIYAKAWSLWESNSVTLIPNQSLANMPIDARFALAFARIEAHYFYHRGFLKTDNHILAHAPRIRHIPCRIIQGRYDAICPPRTAYRLKEALPNARLEILPLAGHSAFEPSMLHALVSACDAIAEGAGF